MKPIKLEIGDCNETDAFLTNEEGFDVACLSRYTPTSHGVGSNEHIAHLLTDEQWQELINRVNHHDELVAALTRLAEKTRMANGIQHSGGRIQPEDWSELYDITNEAFTVLDKLNNQQQHT
jgi:hypothetical protein